MHFGAEGGVLDLGADASRLDLLHLPRGLARLVRSAWESEGGLTGLATVVLEPGRQQVANAVDAAAEGDFRTAASSGVKALSVGVSTGVAIGELGAAALDAVGAAPPEKEGDRGGRAFTRRGKVAVKDANRAANGGATVCTNCGTETVPGQRSVRGVSPPSNETNVDHVIPKAHGGRGVPVNGQVLCRACNLEKSDKMP